MQHAVNAVAKLAVMLMVFAVLFWHWVGNRPEAKCTAACCLILPTMAGALRFLFGRMRIEYCKCFSEGKVDLADAFDYRKE